MPAVNPTQLRFQLDALLGIFSDPAGFHHELSDLFSKYANLALRFGKEVPPKPLINMYHLPFPVIRQLRLDLTKSVIKDPQSAKALVAELWSDPYLEVKETAIFIFGQIPFSDPKPIIEQIKVWLDSDIEKVLKEEILSMGTHTLKTCFQTDWEGLLKTLLSKKSEKMIYLGLYGLSEGLKSPEFYNFPIAFRLISDIISEPKVVYRSALVNLIEVLANRSPVETAYFLRQTLSLSQSSELPRLIKQCLGFFPGDIQENLKSSLNR